MSIFPHRGKLVSAYALYALLFACVLVPAGTATAATHTVDNCNNGGPGSLRNVVANARSGDTVVLSSLGCSRILLTGGAIEVSQDDLELSGPGSWALTIDGNRADRVFLHSGTGVLRLRRVSIANGEAVGTGGGWLSGGCIRSLGSVELIGSSVHHCRVLVSGGNEPQASGGGIWAEDAVLLSYSDAFANSAEAAASGSGGAVDTRGEVELYRSRIYGNEASLEGGGVSGTSVTATLSTIRNNRADFGGGISVSCVGDPNCKFRLDKSTVSSNHSSADGGFDASRAATAWIVDSTISGNTAGRHGAGSLPYEARIFNSTIAFNLETECSGALYASDQLRLTSSIASGNTCTTGADIDISGTLASRISGHDNIIGHSELPMPSDTIRSVPRLRPLADNGGPTRTHLPAADSPALERGSNPLDRLYDQRGAGFPREKGAFPDIGAVER